MQSVDFSTEVIPNLVGRIQTWQTRNMFIDIGNPEALKRAQEIWEISHDIWQ